MTNPYRALCAELLDEVAARPLILDRELIDRARALLAEPEAEGPRVMEIIELHTWLEDEWRANNDGEDLPMVDFARAVLASWGNHPGSPDSSDGPAVTDDREPASVTDQITTQLHRRATILLIRKVIDQAIRDTASVQWRVADTGEQLVRASDLLAWAEHMEKQMEQLDD